MEIHNSNRPLIITYARSSVLAHVLICGIRIDGVAHFLAYFIDIYEFYLSSSVFI